MEPKVRTFLSRVWVGFSWEGCRSVLWTRVTISANGARTFPWIPWNPIWPSGNWSTFQRWWERPTVKACFCHYKLWGKWGRYSEQPATENWKRPACDWCVKRRYVSVTSGQRIWSRLHRWTQLWWTKRSLGSWSIQRHWLSQIGCGAG